MRNLRTIYRQTERNCDMSEGNQETTGLQFIANGHMYRLDALLRMGFDKAKMRAAIDSGQLPAYVFAGVAFVAGKDLIRAIIDSGQPQRRSNGRR
jgi:hypothetical protein